MNTTSRRVSGGPAASRRVPYRVSGAAAASLSSWRRCMAIPGMRAFSGA
ncbi:Uncharacterised protein [Bordetella pertussis]|nr:Uncharacterised protein [Bordetella pertussis]